MVQVLVDLLRLAVLAEHTAEDTHAALPDELERKARVGGTPALTGAGVPSFSTLTTKKIRKIFKRRGFQRGVMIDDTQLIGRVGSFFIISAYQSAQ